MKFDHDHHAVLFVSKQFVQHKFPDSTLCPLLVEKCGIQIKSSSTPHPDLLIIDRERAHLRLEDVEKIKEFCLYPPQLGRKRCVFIENCERLNMNSANSILKFLEEPSAPVFFVFTTAYKDKLLATILSRLQTIYITLPDLPKKSVLDDFHENDILFVQKFLGWIPRSGEGSREVTSPSGKVTSGETQKIFFGKSLSDTKNFSMKPKQLSELIINCEEMSKKYTAEQLRSLIVYCVSERLKKDNTFVIITRFLLAHIRAWKHAELLNPSSQFWLLRIFLGHQLNENS